MRVAARTMLPDPVSQFWKSVSRFGAGAARTGAACLLAAASGLALAAPADDFREGERAYRSGDFVAASTALRRAAEAGHLPSQVLLASILDDAEFDAEAFAWYRKAAEQGDAGGQYGLGSMYLSGEGVKQDLKQGYHWLGLAAASGHERATVALGRAYLKASRNELEAAPDPARAAEWVRKSADLGDLPSIDGLVLAYRNGGLGLEPDAKQADEYAARAAAIRKKMIVQANEKKKKK